MKSARYHALRDRVVAAVDHRFAEPVRLSFMKAGTVDPDRPMVEIEAVLRVGGGKETSVAGGQNRAWRTRINAQRAELHIDPTKYSIIVRRGDRVRAVARHGEPLFEVLAVDDRGMPRLIIQLGEV